jgi:hypothetical protein
VRDHVDGQPHRVAQRGHQFVEVGRADRVQARRRLVEEDEVGVERQRSRQRRALDHAARQFGREFRRSVRRKAHKFELEHCELVHQPRRKVEILAHRDLDVLLDCECRKQGTVLEQHAHAHVHGHALLLARLVEVDTEHLHRARLLRRQSEHCAQQHRLSGARGADEAQYLAAIDLERKLVEHHLLPERDRHVARRQHHCAFGLGRGHGDRRGRLLRHGGQLLHQKSIAA